MVIHVVKNTRPTSPENIEHRALNNTNDLLDESLHATDARDHSTLNTSEHRVPSERESNSISNVDTRYFIVLKNVIYVE